MPGEDSPKDHGILFLVRDDSLPHMPPDSDHILSTMDWDIWDIIEKISERSPYFKDLREDLLRTTAEMPKEERRGYVEEAHAFCSILAGYSGSEYLIRNFFDYLFDKTREMDDEPKREFVTIAKTVYDSVHSVALNIWGDDESLKKPFYESIRPRTNLMEDLKFNKEHYDKLKRRLIQVAAPGIEKRILASKEFNDKFYRTKTVTDVIELIAEIKKAA